MRVNDETICKQNQLMRRISGKLNFGESESNQQVQQLALVSLWLMAFSHKQATKLKAKAKQMLIE